MDLQLEELHSLTLTDVLRESISIPRASPRTFALLTLALVFPLSFAVLAHTLFTHPILHRLATSPSTTPSEWAPLLLYQFAYLLFLFIFSLLSTGAAVFTVASLYAGKPVSFRSTLSSIPTILPRLLRTFLWVSLLMLIYNLAFALALLVLLISAPSTDTPAFFFPLLIVAVVFLSVHVYISAWWHLASVVSVLEPVCGLAALTKSRELLRGRVRMASGFVACYLMVCGLIGLLFRVFVVKGPDEEGSPGMGVGAKVVIGGALVAALVVVNLVGLLVQSVFYYVCKSYHHQMIDKSALFDHLGGYLGEYVPLKSSIQMENL